MGDNTRKFRKIVYFDEDSATDLVYMENEGEINQEIINSASTKKSANAEGEAYVGNNGILKSLLGFKISVDGSMGKSRENLINKVIKNNILIDYLKLEHDKFNIMQFDNSRVEPYKNSLTYYKLVTPYMIMFDGYVDAGDININVALMDKALSNSKGYYEMILDEGDAKHILRFNLNSFRNSYMLPDLVKMDLTYHCIKVGTAKLSSLDINKEFDVDSESIDACKVALLNEEAEKTQNADCEEEVNVYDVILAGVYND